MGYEIRIDGTSPIIMHSGTGIDPELDHNREIARLTAKKTSARTETENRRIRELEVIKSIWWSDENKPTVPTAAIRTCIEKAARKTKQGPAVREGLLVESTEFEWDTKRYGQTVETIAKTTEFTVPVVVQRARILRTRAKFDIPWGLTVRVDTDPDLVEKDHLSQWLELAGRRVGLGDWRPEKSGVFGRFSVTAIDAI